MKKFFGGVLLLVILLAAGYVFVVLKMTYSDGERAGWVQKFSHKGWICKTWEGELAMVSMPGTVQETFPFTVWDAAVADKINKTVGQRVKLHYDQKIGLINSCFGETSYWVTGVEAISETPNPVATVPLSQAAAGQPAPQSQLPQPAPLAQQPLPAPGSEAMPAKPAVQ